MLGWPCGFGPVVRPECAVGQNHSPQVQDTKKKETGKGGEEMETPQSHNPLQRHVPKNFRTPAKPQPQKFAALPPTTWALRENILTVMVLEGWSPQWWSEGMAAGDWSSS